MGRGDLRISEVLVQLWAEAVASFCSSSITGCAGAPPAPGRLARLAENLCRTVGSLSGGHHDMVESSSDSILNPNRQHFIFSCVFQVLHNSVGS